MAKIKIGILEDDADQSSLLELILRDAGYETDICDNGPEFIRTAQSQSFDIMLLDWVLPEMSGLEVLKWVRRNIRTNVPVIFLTTRTEEKSIVAALEAGADDYITKPAIRGELIARIRALARRSGLMEAKSDYLEVDGYILDRKLKLLKNRDETISLTQREFDLAWLLFDNPGRILSRDYLLRNIWNINSVVNTRTVDTHISRIRGKLNLRPENGWLLSSIYHYGYRLERLASNGEVNDVN